MAMEDFEPDLPISISFVQNKFLLFDIKVVSWLRREHRVAGVLIGSLPQAPSQNVFLGLPVELMPEETQLLVSKGIAYVVDDADAHEQAVQLQDRKYRASYRAALRQDSLETSRVQNQKKEQRKEIALKLKKKRLSAPSAASSEGALTPTTAEQKPEPPTPTAEPEESLFSSPALSQTSNSQVLAPLIITPTTSTYLLPPRPSPTPIFFPIALPTYYPLFAHLHSKHYFLSPGLRFGCQYMAYPGDPLRYHSHFLVVGTRWDEEIDLMSIVGGGRLGTGVKKGYLIGAVDPAASEGEMEAGGVKTFSIEWAGM